MVQVTQSPRCAMARATVPLSRGVLILHWPLLPHVLHCLIHDPLPGFSDSSYANSILLVQPYFLDGIRREPCWGPAASVAVLRLCFACLVSIWTLCTERALNPRELRAFVKNLTTYTVDISSAISIDLILTLYIFFYILIFQINPQAMCYGSSCFSGLRKMLQHRD